MISYAKYKNYYPGHIFDENTDKNTIQYKAHLLIKEELKGGLYDSYLTINKEKLFQDYEFNSFNVYYLKQVSEIILSYMKDKRFWSIKNKPNNLIFNYVYEYKKSSYDTSAIKLAIDLDNSNINYQILGNKIIYKKNIFDISTVNNIHYNYIITKKGYLKNSYASLEGYKDVVHEAIMGHYLVNYIKNFVPNVQYTFAYFECSRTFIEKFDSYSWCNQETIEGNMFPYHIKENIGNITLNKFLKNTKVTVDIIDEIVLQFRNLFHVISVIFKDKCKLLKFEDKNLSKFHIFVKDEPVNIPLYGEKFANNSTEYYLTTKYVLYLSDFTSLNYYREKRSITNYSKNMTHNVYTENDFIKDMTKIILFDNYKFRSPNYAIIKRINYTISPIYTPKKNVVKDFLQLSVEYCDTKSQEYINELKIFIDQQLKMDNINLTYLDKFIELLISMRLTSKCFNLITIAEKLDIIYNKYRTYLKDKSKTIKSQYNIYTTLIYALDDNYEQIPTTKIVRNGKIMRNIKKTLFSLFISGLVLFFIGFFNNFLPGTETIGNFFSGNSKIIEETTNMASQTQGLNNSIFSSGYGFDIFPDLGFGTIDILKLGIGIPNTIIKYLSYIDYWAILKFIDDYIGIVPILKTLAVTIVVLIYGPRLFFPNKTYYEIMVEITDYMYERYIDFTDAALSDIIINKIFSPSYWLTIVWSLISKNESDETIEHFKVEKDEKNENEVEDEIFKRETTNELLSKIVDVRKEFDKIKKNYSYKNKKLNFEDFANKFI